MTPEIPQSLRPEFSEADETATADVDRELGCGSDMFGGNDVLVAPVPAAAGRRESDRQGAPSGRLAAHFANDRETDT